MTSESTLTQRLKAENWDMHQIAEHGHGPGEVLRDALSLPQYLELIDQGFLVHSALDEACRSAVTARPDLAPLMDEAHLLGRHFAADLAHFEASSDSIEPIAGTERFIDHIRDVQDQPLRVLGLHYVRTGASNGNRFVLKKAIETFDLPATGEGGRHLDPYGEAQRARWGEFKQQLDSIELTAEEQDVVVASARTMYEHFICWHMDAHLTASELLAKFSTRLDKDEFDRAHATPRA